MCNTVDKQIANLQSQLDELKSLRKQEKEEVVRYPENRKRSLVTKGFVLARSLDMYVLREAFSHCSGIRDERWKAGVLFNNEEQGAAHLYVLNTIMKDPEWIYWFPGMDKPEEEDVDCLQVFTHSGTWKPYSFIYKAGGFFCGASLGTFRYKYKE